MGGTCELGWHVISRHNSFPCCAGIKPTHGARAGHGTRWGGRSRTCCTDLRMLAAPKAVLVTDIVTHTDLWPRASLGVNKPGTDGDKPGFV